MTPDVLLQVHPNVIEYATLTAARRAIAHDRREAYGDLPERLGADALRTFADFAWFATWKDVRGQRGRRASRRRVSAA